MILASGCGQARGQNRKKREKEDPMAPSWVGLPLESVGRWLWVTGLPPDWALLSSRGQSLRGSSETSWGAWSGEEVDRRGRAGPGSLSPSLPLARPEPVRRGRSGPGDIISRKGGCFEKGTKSGWVTPTKKHPKQDNKLGKKEKKPYKATHITNREKLKC